MTDTKIEFTWDDDGEECCLLANGVFVGSVSGECGFGASYESHIDGKFDEGYDTKAGAKKALLDHVESTIDWTSAIFRDIGLIQ